VRKRWSARFVTRQEARRRLRAASHVATAWAAHAATIWAAHAATA